MGMHDGRHRPLRVKDVITEEDSELDLAELAPLSRGHVQYIPGTNRFTGTPGFKSTGAFWWLIQRLTAT